MILNVCFIPEPGESAEPVHLGVLHSEGFAYAGMMKNSFELALEVINQEGGIKGSPLKLIYGNDRGKREPGEKVVKELVKKSGVVMLVGGYQSSNMKKDIRLYRTIMVRKRIPCCWWPPMHYGGRNRLSRQVFGVPWTAPI